MSDNGLKQYIIEVPAANRDRLFDYDWKKSKGGFQNRGAQFLDQLDPPWRTDMVKNYDYDERREVYRVRITAEGIGRLLGDLMERGGFTDKFRKEVWPFIRAYIDNPPART